MPEESSGSTASMCSAARIYESSNVGLESALDRKDMSTHAHHRAPTGIVLMNMGGPADLDAVGPFLEHLFDDRELMNLPMHRWLGPLIARRRTPKVQKLYEALGGGSPILRWTEAQAQGMVSRLDERSPETAPHKAYVAFRYTPPFAEHTLRAMLRDGVQRAIAFSQYPQYSCSTTGTSINNLVANLDRLDLRTHFDWTLIDRWATHPGWIATLVDSIRKALERFPAEHRDEVILVFSAHSLPMSVIHRGDPYPQEVGATVQAVMEALGFTHRFVLAYQSAVGPVRWLGPATASTVQMLGERGERYLLTIPVAFTTDHVETLHELDIEVAHIAREAGVVQFERAPAPNDTTTMLDAMADLVTEHLKSGRAASSQYALRCPGCSHAHCRPRLPNRSLT